MFYLKSFEEEPSCIFVNLGFWRVSQVYYLRVTDVYSIWSIDGSWYQSNSSIM